MDGSIQLKDVVTLSSALPVAIRRLASRVARARLA